MPEKRIDLSTREARAAFMNPMIDPIRACRDGQRQLGYDTSAFDRMVKLAEEYIETGVVPEGLRPTFPGLPV